MNSVPHASTGSQSEAPASWPVILIRLMVGIVFLSEGIQKFLYPAELGAGRFAKIGIPSPELMGPFVGVAEIVCGTLILLGLFTRLAAVVMLINISVALLSTKLPILLGQVVGPFSLPKVPEYGLWGSLHEARADLCMWLGCAFLIAVGGGTRSLDARRGVARKSVEP
jgi:putative oxidoreductase